MNEPFLKPEEHVLSTLERDGSRRWLKPKLSQGILLTRRRIVAYLLIIVFTAVPFIKIAGKPLVLLDIPARRFTIFGYTFLPSDMALLALFLVGSLLSIFLITALFGRVWCGWACPQTVYMEFLFRPIERFFDGTTGKGGEPKKDRPGWLKALKLPVYFLACFYLANTFLAYFVGVDKLAVWMRQSPLENPTPFLIMAFVTVAMMFDFVYFREQVCIIMCPYGRFQSVLLDQSSLIVSYDANRGEPRGKAKKQSVTGGDGSGNQGQALPVLGDCVDCGLCVTTCPTGIDIRRGLQMECINCTQCIDACNNVMHKLGREPDLIRYSNQSKDQGKSSTLLRPRVFIYPVILTAIGSLLIYLLLTKQPFDTYVLRERGNQYTLAGENNTQVRNLMRLKITNRTDEPMTFSLKVLEPENGSVTASEQNLAVAGQQTETFHIDVLAPIEVFRRGRADLKLAILNQDGTEYIEPFTLLGPESRTRPATNTPATPTTPQR